MAEHGEWILKGATLTDATANKEYGVSREFIIQGIRASKLEVRETSMWGNPSLRILRSQLERYIIEQLGEKHLMEIKNRAELRKIKTQIASLKRKLTALQARKAELEMGTSES